MASKFITAHLVAAALTVVVVPRLIAASAMDSAVFKLIPEDVGVVLVIPNLKSFSDEATQCLEGMDRAQFLLGSRPLDQLKSMSGFNVGVDDLGGLAVMAFYREDSWRTAVLVPVADGKAFLAGNFTHNQGDQYSRPDGLRLTVRDLGSHVLMSHDPATAREFAVPADIAGSVIPQLKADANLVDTGEACVFASQVALEQLNERMQNTALAAGGASVPAPATPRSVLMVLDMDALAVIVRGMTRYDIVENPAADGIKKDHASITMEYLPSKPFFWAGGANIDALRTLIMLMGENSDQSWPAWLRDAQTIHAAAYPSPAGLAGGLLNDSAVVIRSDDPAAVRDGIKTLLTQSTEIAGFKRESKWEDAREVKDAGVASAFEIRSIEIPPDQVQSQMIEQFIFGLNGIRGFVATSGDSVVLTFSQRPAVLGSALEAVSDSSKSVETSPVLATMRQWMPAQRDVEGYLGVSQLVEMAAQIIRSFGLPAETLPAIDPAAPPVGFAMSVGSAVVESSLIIPAPVVAMLFDEALRQFTAGMKTPATQPDDDSNAPEDRQ